MVHLTFGKQSNSLCPPSELQARLSQFRKLTAGSYGEIMIAYDAHLQTEVVVKRLARGADVQQQQRIDNEIEACTKGKGVPGIIPFHGWYQTTEHYCLVFDYVKGGDMYVFLEQRKFSPVTEETVKKLFRRIVKSLLFMHRNGIAHKDIKLENVRREDETFKLINLQVLIDKKANMATLIDFGLCNIFDPKAFPHEELSMDFSGSKEYCAPEILSGRPFRPTKADVWSLGVTIFANLFGVFPFSKRHRKDAQGNIRLEINFPHSDTTLVSSAARDLLSQMLDNDPMTRISMSGVKNHAWLKKKSPLVFW
ncbi:hypothetical protein PROFUN_07255 [Planoprotostelium fungivorum]|uniref:Protein kinase domain-containing protein n=1 Tax=Planoprotostelium fungivorum TaxID=1890364 RepID=A0A2P6NM89_9EUKA|nr:hypothetical protein PROFUN_07255 [Planoprotostelium fungivorum]